MVTQMTERNIRLREIRICRRELEAELARLELEEMKLVADGGGVGADESDPAAEILRFVASRSKRSSGEIAQAVFGAAPGDRRHHFFIRRVLTSAGFVHRKSGARRIWAAG